MIWRCSSPHSPWERPQSRCSAYWSMLRPAYPSSAFLVHVAARHLTQSAELKVFLAEVTCSVTQASQAQGATTGGATAAWIDFLSGWLSRDDTDLVEPDSLQKAAKAARRPLLPQPAAGVRAAPRAAAAPAAAAATVYPKQEASSGMSASFGGIFPARHIGDALGLAGSPACNICSNRAHYHGKCPTKWGNTRVALPASPWTVSETRMTGRGTSRFAGSSENG
jgi:hypothetical protein